MENQTTTTRTALKWGVISGVISILISVGAKFMQKDSQPSMTMNTLISIVAIGFTCLILTLAMNEFKKQNQGYLSYSQGLGIGALTGVIWGLLSGGFQLFYTKFIDDSELRIQISKMREQMESQNLPESQIDSMEQWMSIMQNPNFIFILTVFMGLVVGFILSLIIAAIVKKDKSVFE